MIQVENYRRSDMLNSKQLTTADAVAYLIQCEVAFGARIVHFDSKEWTTLRTPNGKPFENKGIAVVSTLDFLGMGDTTLMTGTEDEMELLVTVSVANRIAQTQKASEYLQSYKIVEQVYETAQRMLPRAAIVFAAVAESLGYRIDKENVDDLYWILQRARKDFGSVIELMEEKKYTLREIRTVM